jgi:nitrite reductase/ring-hydroxylating ferredoxin subunit
MARPLVKSVRTALISKSALQNEDLFEFSLDIAGEIYSFIAYRSQQDLRVWLNICPHAGRRLDYAPGKFLRQREQLICAAHGATFELNDGVCSAGPCKGAALTAVIVAEQTDAYELQWEEERWD